MGMCETPGFFYCMLTMKDCWKVRISELMNADQRERDDVSMDTRSLLSLTPLRLAHSYSAQSLTYFLSNLMRLYSNCVTSDRVSQNLIEIEPEGHKDLSSGRTFLQGTLHSRCMANLSRALKQRDKKRGLLVNVVSHFLTRNLRLTAIRQPKNG